jgi:Cu/Ag efflux protein CusF
MGMSQAGLWKSSDNLPKSIVGEGGLMTLRSILRLSTVAAVIALSASVLAGALLAMETTRATEPGSANAMTLGLPLPGNMPLTTPLATGNVVAVDAANGRITLDYRPIPELFLEGGTRIFAVEDRSSLTGLTPGDKIRFGVEREHGAYVVTRISNSN